MKYLDRRCIRIDSTYCTNNKKSKQYSEASTDKCIKACKEDFACTVGYHWHQGSICYHFGVEGATDNECARGPDIFGASHGFVCSGVPSKK